jgi:uncharacterized protein
MQKRFGEIDALRGFALFGICVVNIPFLGLPGDLVLNPLGSALDRGTAFVIEWLFQGKFFLLFSFLFGWGIADQISDHRSSARYGKRLAVLAVLGVAHAALVFHGDILLLYALLGVAIWPLRRLSVPAILRIAGVSVALSAVALAALAAALAVPIGEADLAYTEGYLGGFGDAMAARLTDWTVSFPFIVLFNGPLAFAATATGIVASRSGFFEPGSVTYAKLRSSLWWLMPLALLINAGYALSMGEASDGGLPTVLGMMGLALGGPALAACYLVIVTELSRVGRISVRGAATGRMSLSAYVAEGAVAGLIFNGYGLALYGRLGHAQLFAASVVVFLIVHLLARYWSRWFGQGPLERLMARIIGPAKKAPD